MTRSSYKSNRQNEIDLLRIIAALTVFFFHYTDSFNYVFHIVPGNLFIGEFFRYGYMGVHLFFVISGYVVTMTAMKKSFTEFLISRAERLYPVFWLSCLIAAFLPRIFPYIHTFLSYPSLKAFIVNTTMIPSVFGVTMINPVFWSLLEEAHFYVIISIIIIFKLWNKILIVLICWLIIYVLLDSFGFARSDEQAGVIVPKNSLYFIAGMLFYLLRAEFCSRWKLIAFLSVIFALCIVKSFTFAKYGNLGYKATDAFNVYGYILVNILIFLTFWLIANKKITIRSNRFLEKMGDLTYPFYLIHIYGLGLYWYLRDAVQGQVLLLILLLIILLVSFGINQYFEKPLLRLFKKIRKDRYPANTSLPV